MTNAQTPPLKGIISVPGDKSISHRALIFGALASGKTTISGLLEADDVLRTAAQLRALGVEIEREIVDGQPIWIVENHNPDGAWQTPDRRLYAGNAGTGVRLLMGAVASRGIEASFDGDASLRSRPMGRITDPLAAMGVLSETNDGKLPVTIKQSVIKPITYRLPKPSAQIKSAVLLAALGCNGETVIEEPILCRDHTEKMLEQFGVSLTYNALSDHADTQGRSIHMQGGQKLTGCHVTVPADPSSAAFPIVAAVVTPGSDVTIKDVMLNPSRVGLLTTLREMGATLIETNKRDDGGEVLADIQVKYQPLIGVDVPALRAASMIDEYPILCVAAAHASGMTKMAGLAELRVKESDRLAVMCDGMAQCGVSFTAGEDWLHINGNDGNKINGGGQIATHLDHRIAMSFLIMNLIADEKINVDSTEMIATSFPNFFDVMREIGVSF